MLREQDMDILTGETFPKQFQVEIQSQGSNTVNLYGC